MNKAEIKQALKMRGITHSIIAEAVGVSSPVVSEVISRRSKSHRVAMAISEAIEQPIENVFPDIPHYHTPFVPAGDRKQKVAELKARLSGITTEPVKNNAA